MRYERPSTLKEATTLLAKEKGSAYVLAGGTDLLVRLRTGFIEPDLVVDIKNIASTRVVQSAAGGFKIGSAVTCAELGEHAALKKAWPGVVEAANLIGSKQVQGRCTVTGNLCNASPAADSVPALVAAGAKANIVGPKGKRSIPVEQVPAGPGRTSLKKGEIIESIGLPKRAPRSGDAYLRFIPRTEMDIAVVGVGVSLTLDAKGVCTAARRCAPRAFLHACLHCQPGRRLAHKVTVRAGSSITPPRSPPHAPPSPAPGSSHYSSMPSTGAALNRAVSFQNKRRVPLPCSRALSDSPGRMDTAPRTSVRSAFVASCKISAF